MGDRTTVYYRIIGTVSHTVALELVEAFAAEGGVLNEAVDENAPSFENIAGEFEFDEVNYAEVDNIEAMCAEHGFGYVKHWQAGDGYGAGIEIKLSGQPAIQCETADGEVVLTKSDFKKLQAEQFFPPNLIDSIEQHFARFALDQGVLVIQPPTDAELAEADAKYAAAAEARKAAAPVMAEPVSLNVMSTYRELADGLRNMVERELCTGGEFPDDAEWLEMKLTYLEAHDPGDAVLPPHMAANPS